MLSTHTDRCGRITSTLDAVTVHWDVNCFTWEDEYGDYAYKDIHILASDLDEAFPVPSVITPTDTRTTAAVLPSDDARVETNAVTYSSGAPGRRTSAHLVEPEMCRRFAAGEQARSLRAEAEHLSEWLRAAHPEAARMTAKTIQNRFGGLYRRLTARDPKMKSQR
jgi:hypothetical protein